MIAAKTYWIGSYVLGEKLIFVREAFRAGLIIPWQTQKDLSAKIAEEICCCAPVLSHVLKMPHSVIDTRQVGGGGF